MIYFTAAGVKSVTFIVMVSSCIDTAGQTVEQQVGHFKGEVSNVHSFWPEATRKKN